jgi:hypothetical protein
MNLKNMFKFSSRDTAYDHRKVLNSEDLIKTANLMGYTYAQIGDICDVSKTMISHWGSHNRPEKPTYAQLEPMFELCGRGRFQYELEALPEAAIEYKNYNEYLILLILLIGFIALFWFAMFKPCSDNWDECNELPWYRMGSFEMIKFEKDLEEFKAWRKASKDSLNETPHDGNGINGGE